MPRLFHEAIIFERIKSMGLEVHDVHFPSATPVEGAFPHTEETRLPSIVGKWAIDATKAVPYRTEERKNYERAWPIAWDKVKLEDYL